MFVSLLVRNHRDGEPPARNSRPKVSQQEIVSVNQVDTVLPTNAHNLPCPWPDIVATKPIDRFGKRIAGLIIRFGQIDGNDFHA